MGVLPSKKFLVVVLAALIVLGAWFFVSYKSNSNNDNNSSGKFSYISSLFKSNDKDSDNDGLKDWEETLWKTDSKNPDTDGDGTLDGQEINLGRDPLKPGPDDLYSKNYSFAADKTNSNSIDQLSATEKLSRDFLSQYLSAKALMGGNLDESTKENLINSFSSNINLNISSRIYNLSDIKISSDNSKEAIQNYGNQLGAIIKKYSEPAPEMELIVFKRAIESDDPAELKKLDKNINAYDSMTKEFVNLTVPSGAKEIHLNLVNSFVHIKEIISNLQNFFQDPVGSLMALNQYQDTSKAMSDALTATDNYFRDNGIFFSKDDPGYIINQILK